jgi:hypothetical protein
MDEGLTAWVCRAVYTPRPNVKLLSGLWCVCYRRDNKEYGVGLIAPSNPLKKLNMIDCLTVERA